MLFGKLTLDAFVHGPVETGGQLVVVLGVLVVVGLLFYFKRWGWLYTNWLYETNHVVPSRYARA